MDIKLKFMRIIIYPILALITFTGLNACNKIKTADINISETELTTCDSASKCENIFTLSSAVDSNFQYVADGNYKVFTARKTYSNSQTNLFILAPRNGNSFIVSDKDIQKGLVKIKYISSLGFPIGFKAVGGEIKGKNLLPDKALDQSKWLLEATVYLAADAQIKGDQKLKDTLYIKQYFYPNFVFD